MIEGDLRPLWHKRVRITTVSGYAVQGNLMNVHYDGKTPTMIQVNRTLIPWHAVATLTPDDVQP